jgi:hypothetical protein
MSDARGRGWTVPELDAAHPLPQPTDADPLQWKWEILWTGRAAAGASTVHGWRTVFVGNNGVVYCATLHPPRKAEGWCPAVAESEATLCDPPENIARLVQLANTVDLSTLQEGDR